MNREPPAVVATVLLGALVSGLPAGARPLPTTPALAITQPHATCGPEGAPVACIPVGITGTAFGTPGKRSYLRLGYANALGQPGTTVIRSTDPMALVWTDSQIVVGLTDVGWVPVWVRVRADGRLSAKVPVKTYAYAAVPTSPALPGQPPPLAIAVDAAGRVFVNEEFHTALKMWTPALDAVTSLPYPPPPEPLFAQDLFGDTPSRGSILGEDVIIDPSGRAWFSEGGACFYAGVNPNHSRIVSYDPGNGAVAVYNVPGDDNEVFGLAWDEGRKRLWFTEVAREYGCIPYFGCTAALPARLVSFDPTRIAPDSAFAFSSAELPCDGGSATMPGTCSNVPARACLAPSDCVLAEQICPPDVTDDSACYHEYPIPPTQAGHLVIDDAGAVWFTAFGGGNYLGRLDPASGRVTAYPLPSPLQGSVFGAAPWQIAIARDGAIVFTLFADAALGRFDSTRVADPACLALDATGENPCILRLVPPDAGDGAQRVHSLAVDAAGNTWFTEGPPETGWSPTTSVGFVTPDWRGIVMLPPLGLYPCSADGSDCGLPAGSQPPFHATGIAVDPRSDEIWVAEFSRRRLGRLHLVS